MSLYHRAFAALYDRLGAASERAGLATLRRELLAPARGRVLELGAGTGANLPQMPPVDELVLLEPDPAMARRLERRLEAGGRGARVVAGGAEDLPFGADRFETVVCTLVLCSVGDVDRALREIDRVLAPGGRLLFLEHVRSDEPGVARWQDRLEPLQRRLACGCHPNRRTADRLASCPLEVERVTAGSLPKAPAYLRPLIHGVAVAR